MFWIPSALCNRKDKKWKRKEVKKKKRIENKMRNLPEAAK